MIRRKGTYNPCNPCCRSMDGIRTINGQYPDANREFGINAGEGVSIDPDGNGIRIGIRFASPMVFRGTVGTGGTVASLPPANADNLGWTYVAVSSGSTPDTPAKSYDTGDMLISNSVEWTVVPAGDDPVDWSQITGKPTTLGGYGITDAVDRSSNQVVGGIKTYTSDMTIEKSTPVMRLKASNLMKSTGNLGYFEFQANNGTAGTPAYARTFIIRSETGYTDDQNRRTLTRFTAHTRKSDNTEVSANFEINATVTNDVASSWMTGPSRAYNSAFINDIVTIGSLASNPSVIHSTGNETKTGNLTISGEFTTNNNLNVRKNQPRTSLADTSTNLSAGTITAGDRGFFALYDVNGSLIGDIIISIDATGKGSIRARARNSDGTTRQVTLV